MREQYAGNAIPPAAVERRRLEGLLDEMEKHLSVIADGVAQLYQFRARLLNPRPEGVGKDKAQVPTQPTVESRLVDLNAQAGNIGNGLLECLGELSKAA